MQAGRCFLHSLVWRCMTQIRPLFSRRAAMKASTSVSPPTLLASASDSQEDTPLETPSSKRAAIKASTRVSSPRLPDSDSDSQDDTSPRTPCRVPPEVANKYPALGAPFKQKIYAPPEKPLQRNLFGPKKAKSMPAFTWDKPRDDLDGSGLHPWQRCVSYLRITTSWSWPILPFHSRSMGLRRPSTYRKLEPYVATDRMPKNNHILKFNDIWYLTFQLPLTAIVLKVILDGLFRVGLGLANIYSLI